MGEPAAVAAIKAFPAIGLGFAPALCLVMAFAGFAEAQNPQLINVALNKCPPPPLMKTDNLWYSPHVGEDDPLPARSASKWQPQNAQ